VFGGTGAQFWEHCLKAHQMSVTPENSPKIDGIDVIHVDSYFFRCSALTRFLVYIQLHFKLIGFGKTYSVELGKTYIHSGLKNIS